MVRNLFSLYNEICFAQKTIGWHVIATARRLESMKDLTDIGIDTRQLDVTKHDQVVSLKQQLEKDLDGTLDVLINNA